MVIKLLKTCTSTNVTDKDRKEYSKVLAKFAAILKSARTLCLSKHGSIDVSKKKIKLWSNQSASALLRLSVWRDEK